MSALSKTAHVQGRRDEVPNQELAQELVRTSDVAGIREIAENLWNTDQHIQADCIKVLGEVGELKPELVAGYVEDFIKLLGSKNNRLVWGGMSALSAVAPLTADAIFKDVDVVIRATEAGSVITQDHGTKALAIVAAQRPAYSTRIFPFLLKHLQTCRAKDVPQHSEHIRVAAVSNAANRREFIELLERRMSEFTAPQTTRVRKLLKQI